jgi:hypothetical protein
MSRSCRALGLLRGLLYAAAICGAACGRQSSPPGANANVVTSTPAAPASTGIAPAAASITAPESPPAAAPTAGGCLPSHDGYLRLRMRGDSSMDIDWHDADMQCDGGTRPDQKGMRLTFAGAAPDTQTRLRFVFGIASRTGLRRSRGVPANVTVIFEGGGRLFSTRGDDKCTIDELAQAHIVGASGPHRLRVSGRGFCIGPAAAADGGEGVLLSRFDFAGILVDD